MRNEKGRGLLDISKERNYAIKASVLRSFLERNGVNYFAKPSISSTPGYESSTQKSTDTQRGLGSVTFYTTYGHGGNINFWMNNRYVGILTKHSKTGNVVCNDPNFLKVYKPAGSYVVEARDQVGHQWKYNVIIQEGYCTLSGIKCEGCISSSSENYTYIYKEESKKKYNKRRKPTPKPARIAIKLGGGVQYYMTPLKVQSQTKYNSLSGDDFSFMGNLHIGVRLGVKRHNNRGHILGLFTTVGNMNQKGINRLISDQGLESSLNHDSQNDVQFTNQNIYQELEAGFVFGEWFRLSGGMGLQNINYDLGTHTSTENYRYYTLTTGFAIRFAKAFEWDLNATFFGGEDFSKTAYRFNTSLNIRFNIIRL